ncbi:hypothetical protein Pyn_15074 [Prunus yedoensis var. nudiflora]|uniref:Uncharacterized protein n=1 Tax=Prunus yedoensis var. nudiflora TaxID=2094558 RepID=A0A314ZXD1_PRUYE|nr:hypothetical protein Pyn_15074 [Prunus yedoensis var. nudiflora]
MDVGDEGPEAVGLTVAFEVESESGETMLGEVNWGGLEGPADVVAIVMDHEDEATGRGEEGSHCRVKSLRPLSHSIVRPYRRPLDEVLSLNC